MKQSESSTLFEKIVPISEVPKYIAIAEKTLRNWRAQGIYPNIYIKLGGKVFVDLEELKRIIDVQKEENQRKARRLGMA